MSAPSDQTPSYEVGGTGGSEQRAPRTLGSALDRTAIAEVVDQVRAEPAFRTDGRNSKTIVHDGATRIVVTAVEAGRQIGSTTNDGRIAMVMIEGSGRLGQRGQEVDLTSGDIATLAPGGGWSFRAEQPTALVTCFWEPV